MPSLADSLAILQQHSQTIHTLSSQNTRPAGPFVAAFLHLPDPSATEQRNVLSLIRDATESEQRLFKFVGEVDPASGQGGGAVKRVEKREGGVVTPLKDMQRGGGGARGKDEAEVVLKTALKLVDDYRPMPRARAHIAGLLDAHRKQAERIAELEALIAEATNPNASASASAPSAANAASPKPKAKLSPDEAILAEEAALKALEASLRRLRQTAPPPSAARSPPIRVAQGSPPAQSPPPSMPMQTPAKTPMPHVTNSLVNGATPHRSVMRAGQADKMDRFSPLKFLSTPKRRVVVGSGIQASVLRGGEDEKRSIFGRGGGASLGRSVSSSSEGGRVEATPRPATQTTESTQQGGGDQADEEPDEQGQAEEGDDVTVKLGAPLAPPSASTEPQSEDHLENEGDVTADGDESAQEVVPPVEARPKRLEGVEVDLPAVQAAVEKIWATLPEMMAQGIADGKTVSQSAEDTVKHLHRLSQSDPPPPPSPSSASTLSSLASLPPSAIKAPPITIQTILLANLLMLLLRSDGAEGVPLNEVKERLGAMARARGWEGAEDLGTKAVYGGVGKRVVRIDRRGGGGGKVRFAE